MTAAPSPEFSRPVRIDDLEPGETVLSVEAEADERDALAERFGLVQLSALEAKLDLIVSAGGNRVRLKGAVSADVTQNCVVSLEPVETRIETRIDRLYAREASDVDEGDVVVTVDAEDPPEPLIEGVIDVGEAITEQLALELPPFPRAPGVSFAGFTSEESSESGKSGGPFAALKELLGRRD